MLFYSNDGKHDGQYNSHEGKCVLISFFRSFNAYKSSRVSRGLFMLVNRYGSPNSDAQKRKYTLLSEAATRGAL